MIFGSTTLTNTGVMTGDIFIAKYDSNGNSIWARSAGGLYDDRATSVDADTSGNILMAGYFQAASITFGSNTLNNSGNYDLFIVKYDSNGTAMWANSAGGSNDDRGYAVTSDQSGNVIVAGAFLSSSFMVGSTTITYSGGAYSDIFLVKYDPSGSVLWSKSAGGTYLDEPNALTTDASGNIFMTGIVYSTSIDFGTGALTNSGSSFYCEMFIVKYDVNGIAVWAHNAGASSNNDIAYSVATDTSGNIYVVGIYGNPITFGTITLTGGGVFIVEYDNNGNAIWANGVVGGSGNGVVVDPFGAIYVTGNIYSSSITFGSTTLNNAGIFDMYLAKLETSTRVMENILPFSYSVYPNPFSQFATLEFENSKNEKHSLALFDNQGKTVLLISDILTDKIEIDRTDLASGLYFFHLQTDGEIRASGKLVVE